MVSYYGFLNAYQSGYAYLLRQAKNSGTGDAPVYFPNARGEWNTDLYVEPRDGKIEAFLTSDAVFNWTADVFEHDTTIPITSSATSLSKPVSIPFVVRGLGIPSDDYGMDDTPIEIEEDDATFGTNLPAEKTRKIEQIKSDTFSPRYKAYAFVAGGGAYDYAGPYAQSRLTGDLLDAAVWVDDLDDYFK